MGASSSIDSRPAISVRSKEFSTVATVRCLNPSKGVVNKEKKENWQQNELLNFLVVRRLKMVRGTILVMNAALRAVVTEGNDSVIYVYPMTAQQHLQPL